MNERIDELANQAHKEGDDYRRVYMDYKRFAELIVRECMELGDKALQDGKWPGDLIEEHFGLKE